MANADLPDEYSVYAWAHRSRGVPPLFSDYFRGEGAYASAIDHIQWLKSESNIKEIEFTKGRGDKVIFTMRRDYQGGWNRSEKPADSN